MIRCRPISRFALRPRVRFLYSTPQLQNSLSRVQEIPPTKMSQASKQEVSIAKPPHHLPNGKGFRNPWDSFVLMTFWDILGMMGDFDRKRSRVPKDKNALAAQLVTIDWNRIENPPKDKIQATWLGHASYLIQMEELNILCDPICSQRCSPFQFAGPARYTPPPTTIEELKKHITIHAVVISHNHYDHLDVNTLKDIDRESNIKYFVPLGNKELFDGLKINNVSEMDWWDEHTLEVDGKKVQVICTPCQHFTGRGLFDRMSTLWSSWVLKGESSKQHFYFAGDTGYRTVLKGQDEEKVPCCPVFKEIGEKHGPFDVSCIPIGAYSPRHFMSPVHCSPSDAVCVHEDIRSKYSLAMHWGTFVLTDEPVNDPPMKLKEALEKKNISLQDFIALNIGETTDSDRRRGSKDSIVL